MAQTTVSQTAGTCVYYWGEGGQYGPFEIQQEGEWAGWPDAGQVMRYFRRKAGLTAKELGVLYGKAVNPDGSPVTERQIFRMELENKVPVDINRRKLIARLLNIPPVLFGLAALEDITLEPQPQTAPVRTTGQTKLVRTAIDTSPYQNNVRTLWQLHDTGHAQDKLGQLYADICDLESFEQQAQGDLRYHVQEILLGYQILATHIVRDQRHFKRAYYHANETVRVAKSMDDRDLIATALFTRGWTRLEWGLYGVMKQGIFQVQSDKLHEAIHDFEEAKKIFPFQDERQGMHPQLLGRLTTYMNRAEAALALSKKDRVSASKLIALDDVADTAGRQNINDPYMRVILTGTRSGLHQAAYLSNRSAVFMAAGLPGKALKELNSLEALTENTYRKDETRQITWLDILKANIYIGLEEFNLATKLARQALLACQDINSITNTAIITDIYGRLLRTRYGASSDVKELGEILRISPARPLIDAGE
jgi:transcriptional regulator with XRE-family HTH domain